LDSGVNGRSAPAYRCGGSRGFGRRRPRDRDDERLRSEPLRLIERPLAEDGEELRVELSSSNFPRFDRNLNTGGNNVDETTGVVAHNEVHHSAQYPSSITLSVVSK